MDADGHLDEGTIHAWLDGALAADEGARVEAHVAGCMSCAALVAEARGLIAASSRILSALDEVPSGVLPVGIPVSAAATPAETTQRRPWAFRRYAAAAAVAVVAVGTAVIYEGGGRRQITEYAVPGSEMGAVEGAVSKRSPADRVSAPEAAARVMDTVRPRSPAPSVAGGPPLAQEPTVTPPRAVSSTGGGEGAGRVPARFSGKAAGAAAGAAEQDAAAARTAASGLRAAIPPGEGRALLQATGADRREQASSTERESLRDEGNVARKAVANEIVTQGDSVRQRAQPLSPALRPEAIVRDEARRIAGEPKVAVEERAAQAAPPPAPGRVAPTTVEQVVGCWALDGSDAARAIVGESRLELQSGVVGTENGRAVYAARTIDATANDIPTLRWSTTSDDAIVLLRGTGASTTRVTLILVEQAGRGEAGSVVARRVECTSR